MAGFSFAHVTPTFLFPLIRPPVLCADGDIISGRAHHLPVLPSLFVGDQSPLNKDVVQEDIDDDVVAAVDFSCDSLATTDDMLRIYEKPGSAAEALRIHLLLGDEFFSLPDAEEVLLDLPNDL